MKIETGDNTSEDPEPLSQKSGDYHSKKGAKKENPFKLPSITTRRQQKSLVP